MSLLQGSWNDLTKNGSKKGNIFNKGGKLCYTNTVFSTTLSSPCRTNETESKQRSDSQINTRSRTFAYINSTIFERAR